MRIIEIFSKGCPTCDYIYRVQKRIDVYDKIEHYENGTQDKQFEVTQVPTFFVMLDGKIFSKFENVDRGTLENIKKFFLD